MIPAAFDYVRPTTVEEALQALRDGGDDAKLLAGGQSLLPVLRLRMADPSLIIDLGGIPELKGVREEGDEVVVGAMTSHHDVTRDDILRQHVALIQEATKTVADPQVRHRGTLGGALAHADPAGDLAAPALALEAQFVIAGAERHPHGGGGGLLRGLLRHRHRRRRAPHRDPLPEVHGVGRAVREVQPGRPGLVDRRGRRDDQGRRAARSPTPASG